MLYDVVLSYLPNSKGVPGDITSFPDKLHNDSQGAQNNEITICVKYVAKREFLFEFSE